MDFLKHLDRINEAIRNAKDIEHIIEDVLEAVFLIFKCDRAWLFHPCDPDAATLRVLAEKNTPEYPGAFTTGENVPISSEAAETIRKALRSGSPVVFGPGTENRIDDVTVRFSVQSQIMMAIHPRMGKPWMFGMHQCSHARIWTRDEQLLFKEISFRVVESLNNLMLLTEQNTALEQIRTILDSLDALVYVADMKTHELLFVNQYGRDRWGEVSGKTCWRTLQTGQSGPCEFCSNGKLMDADGNPTGPYVWQFQNTVDREWYECRDQAIRWLDGRMVRMEIATNITRQKEAEEQKKALEEKLRQSQKMEAIGTLAGGIAHDFNNILSIIIGFTDLARHRCAQLPPVPHYLDEVLRAGQRAKSLIMQILAFSRKAEAERIPLDPGSLVKEAVKMLRPSLPSTIDIRLDMASQPGPVLADPTQFHQILMNLGTNAFHAMEQTGGTLSISLKETTLTEVQAREEPGVAAGKFVHLSVQDSGTGIEPDIMDRIFDPFFTTKEAGKGTGMGLSVVHGIVKDSGGLISIDSDPGKGTTVNVFFPVVDMTADPRPESTTPILSGNERVLFIDDEPMLIRLHKTLLEELGYRVTTSSSSPEALRMFQTHPEQFDLVITDQTMPEMTGSELATRMLRIRPDIPIILCSGFSSIITKEKAKSIGITTFVDKPVAKRHLAHLIREALEGREETR